MTLALPKIQRRGVSRLATPDPMLPVREAQARGAMFHAFGAAAETVAGLTKQYVDREANKELRDASLAVHEADRSFVAANRNKEEFDLDTTEDEDLIEIAAGMKITEGIVPAHRVYAELRKKKYDNAVREASGRMGFSRAREEFESSQKAREASFYAEDASRATKDQIEYIARQTMASVESKVLERDFGGARLEIDLSDMSVEAKKRAHTDLARREQTDYFNETIENRGIPEMQTALTQLYENDKKTTSEINAKTQKVLANQLRRALNIETGAVKSGVAANLKMQADDLRSQVKDVWANKPVDTMNMLTNAEALKEKYPVLVREARRTLVAQPMVSYMMLQTPAVQMNTLAELKAKSDGGRNKSYLISQLEKSIVEGMSARSKDTLGWAEKAGVVVLAPIDYSIPDTMAEGLRARLQSVVSTQTTYGTFTGFLKHDGEMAEWGNRLENAPDKLDFLAATNSALGDYAESFYEPLKQYGVGGADIMAGQLMAEDPNNRTVAENILKGGVLRREDKMTQMLEKDANLDDYAVTAFGNLYAGNPKQQSLMIESFKNVWAVTRNKDSAFEQVAGNVIEMNGARFPAPIGVGEWEYKFKLKTSSRAYWDEIAKDAHGYSGKQLKDMIWDGTLTQVGVSKGVTNLYDPNGDVVTKRDGETPLPFSFDPDAAQKPDLQKESAAKVAKWKVEAKQKKAAEAQAMADQILKNMEQFDEDEGVVREPGGPRQ